jgi:hypothetical protein
MRAGDEEHGGLEDQRRPFVRDGRLIDRHEIGSCEGP